MWMIVTILSFPSSFQVDLLTEKQPSKQFVMADQVGDAVTFLSSDSAAQITGISMPIDGGWTAQ